MENAEEHPTYSKKSLRRITLDLSNHDGGMTENFIKMSYYIEIGE